MLLGYFWKTMIEMDDEFFNHILARNETWISKIKNDIQNIYTKKIIFF